MTVCSRHKSTKNQYAGSNTATHAARTCNDIDHVPDERGAQTSWPQRRLHKRQPQRAQRQTHRAACRGTAGVGEWLT